MKSNKIFLTLNVIMFVFVCSLPLFIMTFLMLNRKHLRTPEFLKKWGTMYDSNKTTHASCFLYHVPFCLRRLFLVVTFYYTREWLYHSCIFGILGVNSVYLGYFLLSMPHIGSVFNKLEIFNELLNLLLVYLLFGFGPSDASIISIE